MWYVLAGVLLGVGPADIDRALSSGERTQRLVQNEHLQMHWLPNRHQGWYRRETGPEAHEFVLVDLATGQRQTAKSLAELGLADREPERSSGSTLQIRPSRAGGLATELTFHNHLTEPVQIFWINTGGERIVYGTIPPDGTYQQSTFAGHVWLVVSQEPLATIEATANPRSLVIDGPARRPAPLPPAMAEPGTSSPDGTWAVSIEENQVTIRRRSSGETQALSCSLDGSAPYRGPIHWSPDSRAFVVSNTPDVPVRQVTIVSAQPGGQLQPKLLQFDYAKPGDPLPEPRLVVFRCDEGGQFGTGQVIAHDLFRNPFMESPFHPVRWSPDSTEFYFDFNERGHQRYRILAVNALTGAVRCVVDEHSATFIDYRHKTWRHWLDRTGELLWLSERTGWCHLYLVDVATGAIKTPLTSGNWVVREVLHVDEDRREVWFLAGGIRPGEDPYHQHLCRVNCDGTGFVQLTASNGQHHIEFSPDREVFVATWSRVDHPPVHELRRSRDGELICELERADAAALLATGWTFPERIVAKGRDGVTDIFGILIKPRDFDPTRKYPVVEEIYAGPHSAFVPKEFNRHVRQQQLAELGIVSVRIDGQGTNHRGKAFHDVCWKNLKDAGFPDRIAWLQATAQTRPWLDLSRVGIYGGSAGGQSAVRALLDHHDFYRVAVADCGCHDNRLDKIWWNEQWLGWPVDDSYARNSNIVDADRLQGALLLIVGELDRNVDPASTTQLVGALQRAGKTFDYMPVIGAGHGAAETPYGQRLRLEFLVRHLLAP